MEPETVLLRAFALLVGVPTFLLGVLWLLDRLESWVLKPDERAARVEALLTEVERAEEVEEAVVRLLGPVDSELAPARGLLARARRKRAPARRARAGGAPAVPSAGVPTAGPAGATSSTGAPADAEDSRRRQEALAEAQEALLEAYQRRSPDHDAQREGQSHPA